MRKIIVLMHISLDGVLQSGSAPGEDTSGGFKYGGWVRPYMTEEGRKIVMKQLKPADYLLGGKTFRAWEQFWPGQGGFWPSINEGTKYVLSRTQKKSDWKNSVFIKSVADIKKIKRSKGLDLQVHGSSEVVQLLLKNDLVDELWLKIIPVTIGTGKRLFGNGTIPAAFALTESAITPSGVIIVNYKRAGKFKTGTMGI